MVHTVVDRYIGNEEGIDAFQAPDVVPVLIGERAALMMRIDATVNAKVVLGHPRVELVQAQVLLAPNDSDSIQRDGCNDCSASATH